MDDEHGMLAVAQGIFDKTLQGFPGTGLGMAMEVQVVLHGKATLVELAGDFPRNPVPAALNIFRGVFDDEVFTITNQSGEGFDSLDMVAGSGGLGGIRGRLVFGKRPLSEGLDVMHSLVEQVVFILWSLWRDRNRFGGGGLLHRPGRQEAIPGYEPVQLFEGPDGLSVF